MARHNYLIQRHVAGPDGADANCPGKGAEWRDCGNLEANHADAFGNTGIHTHASAVRQIASLREGFPEDTYRIIQIIS